MSGFALPVVLFLLGIGGALSAGGAFVARQHATSHRAIGRSARVDALAEEWAARTIAGWDSTVVVQAGVAIALRDASEGRIAIRRWLTRTDTSVYWVMVEAVAQDKPLLRRRLGAIVIRAGNGLLPVAGWGWIDLP